MLRGVDARGSVPALLKGGLRAGCSELGAASVEPAAFGRRPASAASRHWLRRTALRHRPDWPPPRETRCRPHPTLPAEKPTPRAMLRVGQAWRWHPPHLTSSSLPLGHPPKAVIRTVS